MIARIEGWLESISEQTALLRLSASHPKADNPIIGVSSGGGGGGGTLGYHVLLPAYAAARLQGVIGSMATLHTLHFLESQNQGAIMLPRLAGFLTVEDRRFYELFCTCKGISHRRALRAMALSSEQIAAAIADRDVALLQSLPEVGRRTAETIVTTLRDKVQPFVTAAYQPPAPKSKSKGKGPTAGPQADDSPAAPRVRVAREALEVLLQLGENRIDAVRWIDQALIGAEEDPRPQDTQALVSRVFTIKSGV